MASSNSTNVIAFEKEKASSAGLFLMPKTKNVVQQIFSGEGYLHCVIYKEMIMFMDYFDRSTVSKNKSMSKLLISVLLTSLLVSFASLSLYGCKGSSSNETFILDRMVECSTELVTSATATVSTIFESHSVSDQA